MKVFISWSGDRSRLVAELLKDWVKCVLQASQPWISTRDIDRGAVWFTEISQQLNDTAVGIVCLTQENKNRPWILFEAGALAKGLSNRVCTFLIDLQPRDLEQPLAQFNATVPDREGMWALARTLNDALGAGALDSAILERAFEAYWDRFQREFAEALGAAPAAEAATARDAGDVLGEILDTVRNLSKRVASLEPAADYSIPRKSALSSGTTLGELMRTASLGNLSLEAVVKQARDDAAGVRGALARAKEEEVAMRGALARAREQEDEVKKLVRHTGLSK